MRKRWLVMLLVFVASMVGVVAVNRGAGAAGVPQDLQALTKVVQDGFTAVQNALSNIQDSLNSLSAAGHSNVRFTPPALVDGISNDTASCRVVNVSDATQTVRAQLIRSDGTVQKDTGNIPLAAGKELETSIENLGFLKVYCKFTVVGGSRTDIRGTLAVFGAFSGIQVSGDKLSVPAE